jgi:hypothetical protein
VEGVAAMSDYMEIARRVMAELKEKERSSTVSPRLSRFSRLPRSRAEEQKPLGKVIPWPIACTCSEYPFPHLHREQK